MKITVIGMGYVGLSNAVLLAQKHEVVTYDIDKKKVDTINSGNFPIKEIKGWFGFDIKTLVKQNYLTILIPLKYLSIGLHQYE